MKHKRISYYISLTMYLSYPSKAFVSLPRSISSGTGLVLFYFYILVQILIFHFILNIFLKMTIYLTRQRVPLFFFKLSCIFKYQTPQIKSESPKTYELTPKKERLANSVASEKNRALKKVQFLVPKNEKYRQNNVFPFSCFFFYLVFIEFKQ